MELPEVLTKEDVANLLQCELFTVEDKARQGELPGVKIGRSWIFPRDALMQRLNEMALASKSKARAHAEERRERVQKEMARNRAEALTPPFRLAAKQGRQLDNP